MDRKEWDEYLRYYNEQKRLERYQQQRLLIRPKTTKITVILYLILLIIIVLLGGVGMFSISNLDVWVNMFIFAVYTVCIVETYGRFIGIKFVECYQHYASEEKRRSCKCIPSCSEYAILCLKKYELIYALLKIRKRLLVTCQGFEYIIDNP